MNKKLLTILTALGAFSLILGGCNKKSDEPSPEPEPTPSDPEPEPEKTEYSFSFSSALLKDKNEQYLNISYDIPLNSLSFEEPGTKFNKNTAILSFAFVNYAAEKEKINDIFTAFKFDNIANSADYSVPENKDSVLFTMGHKVEDGVDIVAVSIHGIGYSHPWENNFVMGASGNHAGFQAGADKVLEGLTSYLANYEDTPTKLWISGYSRSAAIGNIVASTLVDQEIIPEENLYAYLFETPKGIDVSNENEYKSIFNILNHGDAVTFMAPEKYGFKRVGIDIDLQVDNIDEVVKAFNENLVLAAFTADEEHYENEAELVSYLIDQLTVVVENEDPENIIHDLSSRENYVEYYQGSISYLIGFMMSLRPSTMNTIKEQISKMSAWSMMGLLATDGVYNFLKPILDGSNEPYDDEKLKSSLNDMLQIVKNAPTLLGLAMIEASRNSVLRTIQLHAPEVVFPLLLAYGVETEVEVE